MKRAAGRERDKDAGRVLEALSDEIKKRTTR